MSLSRSRSRSFSSRNSIPLRIDVLSRSRHDSILDNLESVTSPIQVPVSWNTQSFKSTESTSLSDNEEEEEEDDLTELSKMGETFLNASVQLLQRQTDTRQEIRKTWYTVQQLYAGQHMTLTAMNQMHDQLLLMQNTLHSTLFKMT